MSSAEDPGMGVPKLNGGGAGAEMGVRRSADRAMRNELARHRNLVARLRGLVIRWQGHADEVLADRDRAYQLVLRLQHRLTNAEIELALEAHARELRRTSPMTFARCFKRGRIRVVLVTDENCDAHVSVWLDAPGRPMWGPGRARLIARWSSPKPELIAPTA